MGTAPILSALVALRARATKRAGGPPLRRLGVPGLPLPGRWAVIFGPGLRATGLCALGLALAAAPAPALAAENEKAGPWSASAKVGPAIEASTRASTQLALQLEIAHAIVGDEGYLGFAPQLQVVDEATIVLPASFQYDVHLPVEDLSIYPRIEVGLAMAPGPGAYGFALQPEIGVKWQVHERAHLVLEPISLPMTFGDPVLIQARVFAGAGADF